MRISQLARKHNLSNQELTSFLETIDPPLQSVHPNAKLNEETIESVIHFFQLEIDDIEQHEKLEEKVNHIEIVDKEAPKKESVENLNNDISGQEENEPEPEKSVEVAPQPDPVIREDPKMEEVILSDQLIEMLDSEEEPPANLSKIKLIKAPKKELSGLKVVGKIDLPAPVQKEAKKEEKEEKEVVTERDLRDYRYPKKKRKEPLTKEEKEKRRLQAKKRREESQERKEKKLKKIEEARKKARQEEHYRQSLAKSTLAQKKSSGKPSSKKSNPDPSETKPKTILGKFWRWLNT